MQNTELPTTFRYFCLGGVASSTPGFWGSFPLSALPRPISKVLSIRDNINTDTDGIECCRFHNAPRFDHDVFVLPRATSNPPLFVNNTRPSPDSSTRRYNPSHTGSLGPLQYPSVDVEAAKLHSGKIALANHRPLRRFNKIHTTALHHQTV